MIEVNYYLKYFHRYQLKQLSPILRTYGDLYIISSELVTWEAQLWVQIRCWSINEQNWKQPIDISEANYRHCLEQVFNNEVIKILDNELIGALGSEVFELLKSENIENLEKSCGKLISWWSKSYMHSLC